MIRNQFKKFLKLKISILSKNPDSSIPSMDCSNTLKLILNRICCRI